MLSVSCSSLLYYPSKNLFVDPQSLHLEPEEIWIESTNNAKLFAWYFHTRKEKAKAIIVYFHGNAENISSHYLNLVWTLEKGYDLFTFDYRGYGRSSDTQATPENTLEDGIRAVRWVHKKNPDLPIILIGQSLGGAIALRTAIELKNEIPFQLIIADSTFISYKKAGQYVLSKTWITWPFQWLSYLVLSDEYAPRERISEISPIPLLIIHGTNDQVISFELGEEIFLKASEPKEFWRIKNGSHIDVFSRIEYQKKIMEKINATAKKQ